MNSRITRIYLVYVLCYAGGVFIRLFGGIGPVDSGEASLLRSGSSSPVILGFTILLGVSTILLALPRFSLIISLLLQTKEMTILHIMTFASMAWSQSPATTFRNSVYIVIFLIGAVNISLVLDPQEILNVVSLSAVMFAAGSVPFEIIMPPPPSGVPGWIGVFGQKNWLGSVMGLGLVSFVVSQRRLNLMRSAGFGACAALILLSQSVTTIYCMIIAIATVIISRRSAANRTLLWASSFGGILLIALFIPNILDLITGLSGRDTSLTGRTAIWAFVVTNITAHPLLGFGYGTFFNSDAPSAVGIVQTLGWNPGYAHNGFLDITLGLGLVGTFLMLAVLWDAIRRARRLSRIYHSNEGIWLLASAVFLALHNITEVDFMIVTPLWIYFVVAYYSAYVTEMIEKKSAFESNTIESAA